MLDQQVGRSIKRGKGRGGFRIFTANIPLATDTQWRKGNLSLSQTWPLRFSCCQAFCSQKKGLSRNVKGGLGGGSVKAFRASGTLSLFQVRLQPSHLAFCVCFLLSFPFCALYRQVSLALYFPLLAKCGPLQKNVLRFSSNYTKILSFFFPFNFLPLGNLTSTQRTKGTFIKCQ